MQITTPSVAFVTHVEGDSVNLLVRAQSNGNSDAPSFAVMSIDMHLLTTLERLSAVVASMATDFVLHINTVYSVEQWGPSEARLVNDSLSVASDCFWFTAEFKHGGGTVETAAISISELTKAFLGQSDEIVWRQPSGSAELLVAGSPDEETTQSWIEDYLRLQES